MNSFAERLSTLRRPRVLIRAAQYYLAGKTPRQPQAIKSKAQLHRLIDDEHHLDAVRRTNDAEYSIKAHIELLADLIAAAQALRNRGPVAV